MNSKVIIYIHYSKYSNLLLAKDVFSSKEVFVEDKAKCALGVFPDIQIPILEKAYYYFETLKFSGWNKFQKGALLTIRAIIGLLEYLSTEFGIDYILTSHLLQDFLG